jgi:Zn-dependent protease with chaperone function
VGALPVLALAVLAVVLAVIAPRMMAPHTSLRLCPGAALVLWQSVTVTGVLAALLVAPLAAWSVHDDHIAVLWAASALSAAMLARLLLSGHRVGTGLRTIRRRHRDQVDVIGRTDDRMGVSVLDHPTPTAYCLPGRGHRIVLTRGALDALDSAQTAALLAHERAHLRARHDLVLEFFTVVHHAVPAPLRCEAALAETHLLVEALADRVALRRCGARPLAGALVAVGTGAAPAASLPAASDQARVRLLLIADAATPRTGRAALLCTAALVVLTTPFLLVACAL